MIRCERVTEARLSAALDLREACMKEASGRDALPGDFRARTARYLREGDQLTLLALAGDVCAGCATLCFVRVLPTAEHPTGLRAHLMNVYTVPAFRRRGIARTLVTALIGEARQRGATEIALDATPAGRPLYRALGFRERGEAMTLPLAEGLSGGSAQP
ncbi:MAG: GNAT family N-acetyltransferase [Aristaeellaceae bacterium]